ncbi:MAG: hypothetical protein ACKVOU_03320 [Cytophagales bacterium]
MSQLQTFLNVLQPTEISKIKKIRLIGKEKRVFDFVYSYRYKDLPEVEEICKGMEITSTHFYKICSVLMDKFYEELIPERGYNLLFYLNRKDLYNHFTHEMLMQEKYILRDKESPAFLENFYLKCFELLQRVSAKNLDEELIVSYGDKYLAAKKNKKEHDEYYVRNSYLATKLYLLKATRKDIETSKEIYEELQKIEPVLVNSSNLQAKFQLNKALSVYYNHSSGEPLRVIEYLEKNLVLIEQHKDQFNVEELALTKCKIAEMHYMNSDFEKSFSEYEKHFEQYKEVLENDFYHHAKFAQIALVISKYDFAKKLIDSKFGIFIDSKQPGSGTMGSLLLAKYYLLNNNFAEANKYIQNAKKLVSKSFYIQYEFETRILENVYFILINDVKQAKALLKKNIKFMNSKGFNLKNSEMIYVFILLQEILKPEFRDRNLSNRLLTKYDLLQKSYAAVYGKLLDLVMKAVAKAPATY